MNHNVKMSLCCHSMPLNILLGSLRKQPFQFRPFSSGFIFGRFSQIVSYEKLFEIFSKKSRNKDF